MLTLVLAAPACTGFNRAVPLNMPPRQVAPSGFALPTDNPVTSTFGMRALMGTSRMHNGIDFDGTWFVTPVFAVGDGVVAISQSSDSYGQWIEIRHAGGLTSRYAHLAWRHASAGSEVKRGDLIGRLGSTGRSTGSHLHFEMRQNGRPIDPLPFLPSVVFVKGGRSEPSAAPPPAATGGNRERLRHIQQLLSERGYAPGPADGLMGRRTRGAIEAFQRASGLTVDGRPSPELLELLESGGGVSATGAVPKLAPPPVERVTPSGDAPAEPAPVEPGPRLAPPPVQTETESAP